MNIRVSRSQCVVYVRLPSSAVRGRRRPETRAKIICRKVVKFMGFFRRTHSISSGESNKGLLLLTGDVVLSARGCVYVYVMSCVCPMEMCFPYSAEL